VWVAVQKESSYTVRMTVKMNTGLTEIAAEIIGTWVNVVIAHSAIEFQVLLWHRKSAKVYG
jgi:hypothetical protein